MAALQPQQTSERPPPHLGERLLSSDGDIALGRCRGEGFRTPANVGGASGHGAGVPNRPSTNPRGCGEVYGDFVFCSVVVIPNRLTLRWRGLGE